MATVEKRLLAAVFLVAGWFYFWCATAVVPSWTEPYSASYYGYETHALMSGQLQLELEPAPELLKLRDPYDPVANAPYRVHDMTLFHGRYYLYFGIAPALATTLPWAILTGRELTEPVCVALFGTLGLGVSLLLLAHLRRQYFSAAPVAAVVTAALVLAFGSTVPALMQSPNFYQVPMAAAYFFGAVAMYCLVRTISRGAPAAAWLAAGSAAWGLAVAARPNYLLGAAALAGPLLWRVRSLKKADWLRARSLRLAAAAVLPIGLVGAGVMLHNQLRFGSPAEFGMKYQLASFRIIDQPLMGARYLLTNLAGYLFALPRWERYFPFVVPGTAQLPMGALVVAPFLWFAAAGAVRLYRKKRAAWDEVDCVSAMIGAAAVGGLLFLSIYFAMIYRYATDFIVWLALWSAVEFLRGASAPARRRVRLLMALGVAGAAGAIVVGLLFCARRFAEPERINALARVLDLPAYAADRLLGRDYGPVRLRVTLPPFSAPATEPLASTGFWPDESDVLYIRYLDRSRVQFGFFHAGAGGPASEPIALDPATPHELELFMGSFTPPAAAWQFRGWSDATVAAVQRKLEIKCDDRVVLSAAASFYPGSGRIALGRNPNGVSGIGPEFRGKILDSSRRPLAEPPAVRSPIEVGKALELELWFPPGRAGFSEPLITTGAKNASDLLYVKYLDDSRVAFGLDHWGGGGPVSEPVKIDFGQPHRLVVWMGSFSGRPSPPGVQAVRGIAAPESRIALSLDGRWLFDTTAEFYPASLKDALVGVNPRHSTAGAMFSGRLGQLTTVPLDELRSGGGGGDPWKGFGPVSLVVNFPTVMTGYREPLVTTGRPQFGDIVFVRYLPGGRLAFGVDHWDVGITEGAPVPVDFSIAHRITIRSDSLAAPGTRRDGHVVVELDGGTVLDAAVPTYSSPEDQIYIARNPIGGSTTRELFTGRIDVLERTAR